MDISMFRNFNLAGVIHELPLHANRNNCKSPNFKLKEFDFTIDSETSSG